MKIGILTFHRAHNYGAVLQCYALQEVLKGMGHEVEVIDYRQAQIEEVYNMSPQYMIRKIKKPRLFLRYVRQYNRRKRFSDYFVHFCETYLNLSAPCITRFDIPKGYKAYIIGSDQVWNFITTNGIDDAYTGNLPKDKDCRVIGYAISGVSSILSSQSPSVLQRIGLNFYALSFRERSLEEAFSKVTSKRYPIVIDPVLLTESYTWNDMIDKKWEKENYVLLYQVRLPEDKYLLKRKAAKIAEILKCRLIDMSDGNYSVTDFVSLFKYAKYVVTSSFHATAFSLLFERPLYAVSLEDGRDSRYKELLGNIGASEMSVDKDFVPCPLDIDYAPITYALNKLKYNSLQFLKDCLS